MFISNFLVSLYRKLSLELVNTSFCTFYGNNIKINNNSNIKLRIFIEYEGCRYWNFNNNLWLNINVSFELYSVTGDTNIYYILNYNFELYFQFSKRGKSIKRGVGIGCFKHYKFNFCDGECYLSRNYQKKF